MELEKLILVLTALLANPVLAQNELNHAIANDTINSALAGLTGDPVKGRQWAKDKNKGNCLACHELPIPEEDFHGTIGPSLHNVSSRLELAQIRLRVMDMKQVNPFTIMPGYYRSPAKMTRIAPRYDGTTILSAQEIEDIVSYLSSLKAPEIGALQ